MCFRVFLHEPFFVDFLNRAVLEENRAIKAVSKTFLKHFIRNVNYLAWPDPSFTNFSTGAIPPKINVDNQAHFRYQVGYWFRLSDASIWWTAADADTQLTVFESSAPEKQLLFFRKLLHVFRLAQFGGELALFEPERDSEAPRGV
jgi:hypothetical protein